jgi:integrase
MESEVQSMAGQLVDRVEAEGKQRVKAIARRIARDAPKIASLGEEDLEKLARVVVAEDLRDELKRARDMERFPYEEERDSFLGGLRSEHTRKAYRAALARLEKYAARVGNPVHALTPAQADDWIVALRSNDRAPASVRLDVNAASAFFSWLERRHAGIRNPFRGTRQRPPMRAKRELSVPTAAEVQVIMGACGKDVMGLAVRVMAELGLRVGALPSFATRGERWTALSKGKALSGPTEETREAFARIRAKLQRAGLPPREPFSGLTATVVADRFRRLTRRLKAEGRISAAFSVHDLRHYFAVNLYARLTHDIYAVSRALGHANVGVTERYLRSIGELGQ